MASKKEQHTPAKLRAIRREQWLQRTASAAIAATETALVAAITLAVVLGVPS